jgi:hypothetical protein
MSEKPDAALDVIYSVSERVWSQQSFRNLSGRCTKELELAENCGYLIVIDAEEIGQYAYAALIQAVAQLELSLRRPAFSKVVIVCAASITQYMFEHQTICPRLCVLFSAAT